MKLEEGFFVKGKRVAKGSHMRKNILLCGCSINVLSRKIGEQTKMTMKGYL